MNKNSDSILTINILEKTLGDSYNTSHENYAFHCPYCNHRKHKLEIDLSEHSFGVWHCWVCDKRGNSLYYLLRDNNAPIESLQDISKIESKYHKYKSIHTPNPSNVSDTSLKLPNEFTTNLPIDIKEYLHNRGINDNDIKNYNIGWCSSGRYVDRIIIPSYDKNNKLNYFMGRYKGLLRDIENYMTPMISKSDVVIFESLVDYNMPIFLFEGGFDAITFNFNAIPLGGKTISNRLKINILNHNTPELTIVLDPEETNRTLELASQLYTLFPNTKIYYVLLDGVDDANKRGRKKLWNDIASLRKIYTPMNVLMDKLR